MLGKARVPVMGKKDRNFAPLCPPSYSTGFPYHPTLLLGRHRYLKATPG